MDRINGQNTIDLGGGRRGFRNRNTAAGLPGTEVTASWLNDVQENIITAVEKSGLAPDEGVWTLLARAMRSQALNHCVAGGTANALTITLDPAPISYDELKGTPLQVEFSATNTAAAVASVNGLAGEVPIVRPNGEPVLQGDLIGGRIGTLIYNGNSFQLASIGVKPIFTGVSRNTAGAFSTVVPLDARLAWVIAVGGGGGGGGTNSSSLVATGGGGGEYREGVFEVTPGATLTGVVGAGGTAGNATPTHGGQGGASSFAGLITANGGGGGGSNNQAIGAGGSGGSGGFLTIPGRGGWQGGTGTGINISGVGGTAWCGMPSGPTYGGGAGAGGGSPGTGGNGAGSASSLGGPGAPGLIIIRWLKGL